MRPHDFNMQVTLRGEGCVKLQVLFGEGGGGSASISTCNSLSMGFMLHVEYTMRPPIFNSVTPRRAIVICSLCSPIAGTGDHFKKASGFLRAVPSPACVKNACIVEENANIAVNQCFLVA